ncbi:MAG: GAF domain-containing sensor histidine kinase [Chloroflexi bacterium]|nr:GAF domain-containing sensor histidine kinase [Chloroflexota bacterium]
MALEQTKILARLLEVTRSLGTLVDLETYIRSIFSAAAELTGSESASLMEYDETARELYYKFVPWFQRETINFVKIPLDESAAGWVFLHNQPLTIDDVTKDDRHYSKTDEMFGIVTRSLLVVPLLLHGKPVGVLEVINKTDGNYTGDDIAILESLASLAMIAMQNDLLEGNTVSSQKESRDLDQLKNEFIAITSHELRTPLGLILGHATFLRELVGDEHEEQMDSIIRNAVRLKEIIESLSSVENHLAGSARLRQRRVSIARIIEDVSASFRDIAFQKGVALNVEVSRGDDLFVNADAGKTAIVLSNLVKNAITFTNKDGYVTIRGERQPDFIKVTVEDNGVGIPAKDLQYVFERFYQVESHLTRKNGGMGLGLSVAKVMIELHDGRIWAESTEGIGSTFTFILPLEQKNTEEDSAQPFAQ